MRLIALLLITSCTQEVVITEDQACTSYVKALCGRINQCYPALIKIAFGDQAACESRSKGACVKVLHDPGTTLTTNRLDACAQKLMAQTCADSSSHIVPEECKVLPGALSDGTPCGDSGQCKSAYCKKAATATCGVCATRDGSCETNEDCESGLVCGGQTCVKLAAMGETCGNVPCAYGLVCDGGTCKTPPGAGQACTPNAQGGNCDVGQGFICNPLSMVCQSVGYAKAGETCGFANQTYSVCTAASTCTSMVNGNCMAPAADGAACNEANGPGCTAPANCVNSICTLPDTSTCK